MYGFTTIKLFQRGDWEKSFSSSLAPCKYQEASPYPEESLKWNERYNLPLVFLSIYQNATIVPCLGALSPRNLPQLFLPWSFLLIWTLTCIGFMFLLFLMSTLSSHQIINYRRQKTEFFQFSKWEFGWWWPLLLTFIVIHLVWETKSLRTILTTALAVRFSYYPYQRN
jgi:hypothetical protein